MFAVLHFCTANVVNIVNIVNVGTGEIIRDGDWLPNARAANVIGCLRSKVLARSFKSLSNPTSDMADLFGPAMR